MTMTPWTTEIFPHATNVTGDVLLPAEGRELDVLTDDDQLSAQLNAKLAELTDAMRRTKHASGLAKELKNRNWFGTALREVSGGNTKDLAGMVQDLGGSLEVTQAVVQLIMQLQIKKHNVLTKFHSALVNKIATLAKDATTLDSNQRDAAIAIISTLKDHVEDQIRYQDLVDEHDTRLQQLAADVQGNSELISTVLDELHSASMAHSKAIAELRDKYRQYSARLDRIESAFANFTNTRARAARQLPALAAILVAVLALALHFVH